MDQRSLKINLKTHIELSKTEDITHQKLWVTAKTVL